MLSRKPVIVFVVACIFANIFLTPAFAQRKLPPKRPPGTTSPAARFDPDKVERMEIQDTGNDFAAKGLPPPAEFGGPPTDEMAARMAKEISNYDNDSLPLLIAMLQRAGFFIINIEQKVLYQPTTGTGTGLAFYDFEVAGMYKLSRRGLGSSVEKIAGLVGKETAAKMPPPVIAAAMLQDLRSSYNSTKPLVRFWARLIVEFGHAAPTPIDLMTASPAAAQLNMIQTSLWERRLIGDVVTLALKVTGRNIRRPDNDAFSIIPASYGFTSIPAKYGFADSPCPVGNVEGLILDASATGLTTGHGKVMELIEGTLSEAGKKTFGKITKGLGIVNIVLAWAKLVAALMTLKGEIKIADPMPLVRTKNSEPGEYRMMTARVWAEVGKLEVLNCTRLALNVASGLDFNMPSDGPLSDRDMSWIMTGDSSFSGQGSSKTGKYDNFVNFEAPSGADRNPMKQITDDNGESKMNLVGAPKIPAVINQPVVPVHKKAGVTVRVSLKSARDKAQNFLDIGSGALGIALGGPVGIISLLAEIGFRMEIKVAALTVPVKDWQLCTSDWAGTVYMTRYLKKTEAIKNSSRTGTRTVIESAKVEFILNPRKRDVADKIPPPKPADVYIKIDNTDIFEGVGVADVCCNDKSEKDTKARIRDAREFHANNVTKSHVLINLSDNFLLTINAGSLGSDAFKGIQHNSFTVSESACPVDEDKPSDETFETVGYVQLPTLDRSKTGRRLLNKGESLEELWGEDSFTDVAGAKVLINWTLARCGED